MNIPSSAIYEQFAHDIEPHIYQSTLMGGLGIVGLLTTSFVGMGLIVISAKQNPYTNLSVNDQIPMPRMNLISLTLKIGIVALCIIATCYALICGEYHRCHVNQIISKAVQAEGGQMTGAKMEFLKTFGGKCSRLLGHSNIYVNLQSNLMHYMPTARFFNMTLNVEQFVDPSYIPPSTR